MSTETLAPADVPGTDLDPRRVKLGIAYGVCLLLALASMGRAFGTDIGNYRWYFSAPGSDEAITSLEPLYRGVAALVQAVGLPPDITVELVAICSFALLAAYVAREENPVAAVVIACGWLLFQQFWGTIRSGLGIAFLLLADRAYLRDGRFRKRFLLGPLFHWSLVLHPVGYLVRCSVRTALVVSSAVYAGMLVIGSAKDAVFALLPSEWSVVADYAALQTGTSATAEITHPAVTALVIHIGLVLVASRIFDPGERERFLGPLTVLYVSSCVFFDFEMLSGRVTNVLIGFKIVTLTEIYRRADRLSVPPALVRGGIVAYCLVTAGMYVAANADYFFF